MGARIEAVTEADAVRALVDAAAEQRGYWTITANLDHLRRYSRDDLAKQLIDSADAVVADGTPLIWASRLVGTPLPERVAGSKMIWSICEAASHRGESVFLLGGAPGAAGRAAQVLTEHYPGLEIAGISCPPMGFEKNKDELNRLSCEVADAAPQIVLVGLGFPKQDVLIDRLRRLLPRSSFVGVGISLSFVAGDVSCAPAWTHRLGLEWIYRLLQEPRRLFGRYLVRGLPFALRMFASAVWHRVGSGAREGFWGWDYTTNGRITSERPNAHDYPSRRYQ